MTNLVVDVCAGGGKTRFLVGSALQLAKEGHPPLVLCFGHDAAEEFGRRGYPRASTFHSHCYRAVARHFEVGRLDVEVAKMWQLALAMWPGQKVGAPLYLAKLSRAVGLVPDHPATLWPDSPEGWADLATRHGLKPSRETLLQARQLAAAAWTMALNNCVDFDDLILLVALGEVAVDPAFYVLVDEAQDLSPPQLAVVKRLSPTHVVAVGDRRQAIYGWRGAEAAALDWFVREFKAEVRRAAVTWRCPTKVVELNHDLVPDLRARPGAPAGQVARLTRLARRDLARGDLVLCRNRAPLLKLALQLLDDGAPVRLIGSHRADPISRRLREAGRQPISDLLADLRAEAVELGGEGAADVDDVSEAVLILADYSDGETAADLLAALKGLWGGLDEACVQLATIHGAKGLEAPRTVLMQPALLPSKFARLGWQLEQEANLRYVAQTRPRERLDVADVVE